MEPKLNPERVIFEAREKYAAEKKSWYFSGILRPLYVRISCWFTRGSVTDTLSKLLERQEITPQELRWFSKKELDALKASITQGGGGDLTTVRDLFKRAINQAPDVTRELALADLFIASKEKVDKTIQEFALHIGTAIELVDDRHFECRFEMSGEALFQALAAGLWLSSYLQAGSRGVEELKEKIGNAWTILEIPRDDFPLPKQLHMLYSEYKKSLAQDLSEPLVLANCLGLECHYNDTTTRPPFPIETAYSVHIQDEPGHIRLRVPLYQ